MNIRTTVVCLPVRNLDKTLTFYQNVLGLSDIKIDERIIIMELPNLSLFLMEKDAFETYTKKAERKAQFPNGNAGAVISCAMETEEEVDAILWNALKHGGVAPTKAVMDKGSGGYIGYFSDPDGHLWEIVYPQQQKNLLK